MQLGYRSGINELIWAMTTCHPDLIYSSLKHSQSNSCPHYHGLKHALKYLYHPKDNGIYFWRTHPCMELPEGPLPMVNSTCQDISSTLTLHMPMSTLTGRHAPKLDVRLVVLAYDLLGVQLLTNVSSSQQSLDHQQKQNSWPPMKQGK